MFGIPALAGRYGIRAALALVLLLAAGCGNLMPAAPTTVPVRGDPSEVLNRNIAASNAEDIPAYMETLHPDAQGYAETEAVLVELIRLYDLNYSLSDLRVESQTATEARVYGKLTTRKIRGGDFENNRLEATFILRPYQGEWRIFGQEVLNVSYFEE